MDSRLSFGPESNPIELASSSSSLPFTLYGCVRVCASAPALPPQVCCRINATKPPPTCNSFGLHPGRPVAAPADSTGGKGVAARLRTGHSARLGAAQGERGQRVATASAAAPAAAVFAVLCRRATALWRSGRLMAGRRRLWNQSIDCFRSQPACGSGRAACLEGIVRPRERQRAAAAQETTRERRAHDAPAWEQTAAAAKTATTTTKATVRQNNNSWKTISLAGFKFRLLAGRNQLERS